MNTLRANRKSIGINFSSRGESEVMVWAPHAQEVSVILAGVDERIVLIKRDHGYFSCITSKLKPGDRYFLELDQRHRYADPASQFQPEGIVGPSEIFNPHHFRWNDDRWTNIPLKDYLFYEIHTGTFTPSGTFSGVQEKLAYLKDLGITAIELMPVAEFSGLRNWGYDGVFPFAVHHGYGGPASLQRLVDACHKEGIAVVLDVVYNHMGPEGNNLQKFGPFFTEKYSTPWGSAMNFDDAGSDEVRRFFIENALMWFRDFHIDALRLDAVHAIRDFGPVHILKEIRQHTDQLSQETGRPYYLVAECDLNDPKYIQPIAEGGYGMNAQWNDEFHHALRVTSGNESTGYYEDFNGLLHLAKSYVDAYIYDGIYSPHRQKTFGAKATGIPQEKFVVFSQNHDQVGNRMLGERTTSLVSFEMRKVLAAAVLMSPYLPLLFMGEEYSETNPFLYFVNHGDEKLISAVREGRKKEFKSFHNGGDVPDPQSEQTFLRSKLQWELIDDPHHNVMLNYYKMLIATRKLLTPLRLGTRSEMDVKVFPPEKVFMVTRWHEGHTIIALFNFSSAEQTVECPARVSEMRMALHSASSQWGGPLSEPLSELSPMVSIAGESVVLYASEYV
ncbi:MAG TPA: malto-oligosyltrehalose trehalohydrolase [Chryseolinea sp.]|nr:malto-oligosyltrehalose trehalohydrolase [Chryseolinea sp.]